MKKLIAIVLTFLVFNICGLGVSVKGFNKEKNLCLYVMSSNNKKFNAWREAVISDIAKYYKVIVISNGELNDTCKGVDKIIKRPNTGHDFGAWKEYIIKNYEYIKQFDNFLIANDSFYRVAAMDDVIKKGINGNADLYGIKYTQNRNFLESYFINIKKRVVNSKCFLDFWKSMPEIKGRRDACDWGEAKLTSYFVSRKFTSQDFKDKAYNLNIYNDAKRLTDEYDFPIVKRKSVK